VLQCVAVCCSVLQYVAVCCSVLQCAVVHYRATLYLFDVRSVAVCYSVLQCAAVCCSIIQINFVFAQRKGQSEFVQTHTHKHMPTHIHTLQRAKLYENILRCTFAQDDSISQKHDRGGNSHSEAKFVFSTSLSVIIVRRS